MWTEIFIPYKTITKINLFESFRIIIIIPRKTEELRLFSKVLILFFATKQHQLGQDGLWEMSLPWFLPNLSCPNGDGLESLNLYQYQSLTCQWEALSPWAGFHWSSGYWSTELGQVQAGMGNTPRNGDRRLHFVTARGDKTRRERSVPHKGNCNTAGAILHTVCSSACQGTAISVSVDVQEQETFPKHNWRLTNNFRSLC